MSLWWPFEPFYHARAFENDSERFPIGIEYAKTFRMSKKFLDVFTNHFQYVICLREDQTGICEKFPQIPWTTFFANRLSRTSHVPKWVCGEPFFASVWKRVIFEFFSEFLFVSGNIISAGTDKAWSSALNISSVLLWIWKLIGIVGQREGNPIREKKFRMLHPMITEPLNICTYIQ